MIVEPVVGNMGCVPPVPGFLETIRELTTKHGAVFIFDEVMTGLRLALGGAQQRFNIKPDLTTLGKIIGGGLPLAAYGGRADIMSKVAPSGPIYQAGTLSGNPLAVAAGLAVVRALRANHAIWYAPDQGKRTKSSEILPFFGVPAITNTATSKIAEMTDCAVVPYFAKREADHSYTLTLLPALENFPTNDAAADAVRVNRLIEDYVRRAPEQYFWVHKRFKARGEGYPEVY